MLQIDDTNNLDEAVHVVMSVKNVEKDRIRLCTCSL
jgi:hypothetical protein